MIYLRITNIAFLFLTVAIFLIILLMNGNKYSGYVMALEEKEFALKKLYPFGLYILDRTGYSFDSAYDRKILNFISEIYGQEYSSFYVRVLYANKIIIAVLFIIVELFSALASKYDSTFCVYVILLFGFLFISDDTRLKNKVKKRRLEMQLEFPNFINKLTLLLNAGMTMTKAWEKISEDRISAVNCGQGAFYSEVDKTVADLRAGKNEAEAYSLFAKRVKTPEISRLMSTILQNTKRGGNDLVLSLRLQANECWEMRKNAIKKLGEEASTKLLFPMMIMFFAIIIIVVTPAVISMQGATSNF